MSFIHFHDNLVKKNEQMKRIESLNELIQLRKDLQEKNANLLNIDHPESIVQVKVGMATSGIASGAKEVFHFFKEALAKRNIESMVLRVGDMGYCYAEPTVEVTLPGKSPVVFGPVDIRKADEIIEQFIRQGETLDGIIPINYSTIDEIGS